MFNFLEIIPYLLEVPSGVKLFIDYLKLWKQKRILSCKNGKLLFTNQTYEFHVDQKDKKFVLLDDMELQIRLANKLAKIGIDVSHFDGEDNRCDAEIHIGSPMKSIKTNHYFTAYFHNFKWHVTNQKYEDVFKNDLENMGSKEFVNNFVNIDNNWEGYVIGGIKYGYETFLKDCVVITKLTIDKTKAQKAKTVHMLFGIGSIGRRRAVEYFLNNSDVIYNDYKKSKNYFLVAECDGKGNIGTFKDFSEVVFK